jgi:hypothetical protein
MITLRVEKIVRETEKAIAVYPKGRFVWLPKSRIEIRKLADGIEIDIPEDIWQHNRLQYSTKLGGLK